MLAFKSVMDCELNFDTLLWADRAAGQVSCVAGRAAGEVIAGQATAGRTAGQDVANCAVRAGCGSSYCGSGGSTICAAERVTG